jgi:hypothetical protein
MRFTGMGRDRKYEIRNTELKPMSNAEHPVQNIEGKYNVPGTKYKVGIRIWTRILPLKDIVAFKKGTFYFVHFFRLDT